MAIWTAGSGLGYQMWLGVIRRRGESLIEVKTRYRLVSNNWEPGLQLRLA
jgi:hypothetical protein